MRNSLILFLAAIAVFACKTEEKPPISKKKFIDLLIDFSANEAVFSRIYDTDTNTIRIVTIRNARVLEKHKVSKEDFVKTYRYYDKNKEELLEIYNTAIKLAESRKDKLQNKVQPRPAKDTAS